jgi:formylglycine-generating enzyme required for sulfatase activity/serine/threonine protein kinase
MISFACPACSKLLKVKDDLAGKRVKCPGCGKPTAVPPAGAHRTEAGKRSPVPATGPSPAEEPALPPRGPGEPVKPSEEATLPPGNVPGIPESADSSGSETVGPGPKSGGHPAELTEFLAPAESPDELGRLGTYRVLAILGHGGMGVVFRAEDPHLERLVALKAMLPSLATSPSAKERFFREAKAAAALKHPHIVTIHQVGEDRGAPFLAMEFLEGESLDDRLRREGRLPPSEALRIGEQIARGLAAAHGKGLIHRDIKPGNIWLEGQAGGSATAGHVKILDFGLARALADQTHLTQTGAIVGTPAYMAPEQATGRSVDQRCDLFSLGCVLYRMLTGELPFKGSDTLAILSALALDTPPAPAELRDDVPAAVSDLVMELLEKNPEDRPHSAEAVAERLAALAQASVWDGRRPGTATRSPVRAEKTRARSGSARQGGRWAAMAGAVVLVLLLVGLALVFALQRRTGTLVVNLTEPDVEVLIDGDGKSAGVVSGVARLDLLPGEHRLIVKRGSDELFSAPFTIKRGAEVVIDAKWSPQHYTNSLGMEFVLVPRGKSWLGGGGGQPGTKQVEIKEDFYLGKYEVTQEDWGKVMGAMPSNFSRAGRGKDTVKDIPDAELKRFPVENVSWDEAQLFLKEMNKRDRQEGWVYRLPTEVEWEYACRGGPKSDKLDSAFDFYFDKPLAQLQPEQGNIEHGQGLQRPCKVGSYPPNSLGLYDMHGNVWEWCDDEEKVDKGASLRVSRGGGWNSISAACRAARRKPLAPWHRGSSHGLRVARVPVGKEIVKILAEEKKAPPEAKLPPTFNNDLGMEFVLVPRGKSWLGGGGGKPGDKEVEFKEDFYLGKYEVTQEEWGKVMGAMPSHFSRAGGGKDAVKDIPDAELKRFPVEMVSWDDAQEFLRELNKRDKQEGWVYRLPTEAEWEYACRGGPMSDRLDSAFDFYLDKPVGQLQPEQANFEHGKGMKRTCKVGSYPPNKLGLYDMHGNVWEWCDDEEKVDKGASQRVIQGGSWDFDSGHCRAANRHAGPPSVRYDNLGVRLARVPVGKEAVAPPPAPPEKTAFKNSLGMEFVLVPRGKSWLGGGGGKPGDKDVEIKEDFYLGKYEVTQEEWRTVRGTIPSYFSRVGGGKDAVRDIPDAQLKRFPVEMVSWQHAQLFLAELNKRDKEEGWVYRLPTEVEWEYACRGGPMTERLDSTFDFYLDKPVAQELQPDQANIEHARGLNRTCQVGSYPPNKLGLYDMHGNVSEWCDDAQKVDKDKEGSRRVVRGGSWFHDFRFHGAAARSPVLPSARHSYLGFRVARVPVGAADK